MMTSQSWVRTPLSGRLASGPHSGSGPLQADRLTKAGNAHLRAQLAWVGLVLPAPARGRRRDRPPPAGPAPEVVARAWAAQQRLCARFRALAARRHTKSIVAAAIARELAGFLWAEMTA
jgi:transposase